MSKIRRNDEVVVLAGRDKGRHGKVLRILPEEDKAIVEKVNIVKRHKKPDRMGNAGGIVEKEAPIHVSNLAIYNPGTGKADRIGYKFLADGQKARVYKSNGEVLPKR